MTQARASGPRSARVCGFLLITYVHSLGCGVRVGQPFNLPLRVSGAAGRAGNCRCAAWGIGEEERYNYIAFEYAASTGALGVGCSGRQVEGEVVERALFPGVIVRRLTWRCRRICHSACK